MYYIGKEECNVSVNKLVKREVYDTFPPTVEYPITAHRKSLDKVLEELHFWGMLHCKEIIGK
jgi:DNA-binding HxlR family transcriptional regulator